MTTSATPSGSFAAGQLTTELAREELRRLFHRHLASWAMDVLALQRCGLDRPSLRDGMAPAAPMRRAA